MCSQSTNEHKPATCIYITSPFRDRVGTCFQRIFGGLNEPQVWVVFDELCTQILKLCDLNRRQMVDPIFARLDLVTPPRSGAGDRLTCFHRAHDDLQTRFTGFCILEMLE